MRYDGSILLLRRRLQALAVLLAGFSLMGGELTPGEILLQEGYAYRAEGRQLQAAGNLQGALAAYRKAIAVHPGYGEAYNDLGVILESLDRIPEAEEAYKTALKLDPNLGAAHTNLAFLYEQVGKIEEASQHWGARVKMGTLSNLWVGKARERLAKHNRAVPQTAEEIAGKRATQTELAIQEGQAHRKKKQWDQAIASFEKALSVDPSHKQAARLLKKTEIEAKQHREREVRRIQAEHARAVQEAAEQARKRSKLTEKEKRVLQAPEPPREMPPQVPLIREQAVSDEAPVAAASALKDARVVAEALVAEKTKNRQSTVQELYQRGLSAMRKGYYEEATTHFQQILTLDPANRKAQAALQRADRALAKTQRKAARP